MSKSEVIDVILTAITSLDGNTAGHRMMFTDTILAIASVVVSLAAVATFVSADVPVATLGSSGESLAIDATR